MDHTLSEEDSGHRCKKLSENKASGNQEILSGLGIYRDRNKTRSCSFVYGHSPKVCGKQSSDRGETFHFDNIVKAPSIVIKRKDGEKFTLIDSGKLVV